MINTSRLRALIGWLGIMLPWIVVLLIGYFPQSISHTWYTNACTPFMIILGSACLLLFSYKGYNMQDDLICTLAGMAGIMICLFPTATSRSHELVGTFLVDMQTSSMIHDISAVIFFGLLSYNSIFLFTKSSGEKTRNKKIRNAIYIVCGIGMVGSFALLLLPYFFIQIWLVETIALFFFGISWLTKANIYPWLFMDKEYQQVDDDSIPDEVA